MEVSIVEFNHAYFTNDVTDLLSSASEFSCYVDNQPADVTYSASTVKHDSGLVEHRYFPVFQVDGVPITVNGNNVVTMTPTIEPEASEEETVDSPETTQTEALGD